MDLMRWFPIVLATVTAAGWAAETPVSFNKHVLPVLQKNCQTCHRPGEAGPMPFMTYKDTRPWAKAIKEAVALKKMPPWFAGNEHGKFSNQRSLTPEETAVLTRWAENPVEGNPEEAPPPARFPQGWSAGEPDLVLQMPEPFAVPASGTIAYQHFVVPTNFAEDKWVRIAELRPGDRSVVHHALIFVRPPGSKYMSNAKPGEPFVAEKDWRIGRSIYDELLDVYVPGVTPQILEPGRAKLIKAGSDLIFQLHYTTNGKATTDRSRIGLTLSRETPKERVYTMAISTDRFAIPPGAPNHQVDARFTLQENATVVSMNPHMHLRGKAFEYRVVYPDGRKETLLQVPRYIFSWQMPYVLATPLALPRGARVECTAWYDNSPNNSYNPDPAKEVRWGDQSWEEMMVGFMDVAFDAGMDPMRLYRPSKPATTGGE